MQQPYVEFSREGKDFIAAAYQHGWVLDGFDWMEWSATQDARDLTGHPDAIARASPEQLWKLITKSVREDRFVEGALVEDFERGHLTAIARRAKVLRDAM